jgi:hypothetical protein
MLGADAYNTLAQVSSYCAISAALESYSAIASVPYLRHRERSGVMGTKLAQYTNVVAAAVAIIFFVS